MRSRVEVVTLFLLQYILCIDAQNATSTRKTITIGIAAAEFVQQTNIGWSVCGGAIPMAIDYMKKQGMLQDIDFVFHVNYTECDPTTTVGVGVDFMKTKNVDVVIGPPCPQSAKIMGTLSTFYQKTMLGWGYMTSSDFNDMTKFPYVTSAIANSLSLGYATNAVLAQFDWDRVSILYVNDDVDYCQGVMDDVEYAFSDESVPFIPNIVYKAELRANSPIYNDILQRAKQRSRVIITCFGSAEQKREFMWRAKENGMDTDEFVIILLGLRSLGFVQSGKSTETLGNGLTPVWVDTMYGNADGKDNDAKQIALRMLAIDLAATVADPDYLATFQDNVVARVRKDPFFCNTAACLNNTGKAMGSFARHLHDIFYLYGKALTNVMGSTAKSEDYRNATTIFSAMQMTLEGLTGQVTINRNGTRDPLFMLYGLNELFQQVSFSNLTYQEGQASIRLNYVDETTTIWATRGGKRPLSVPVCGFLGTTCPKDFWEQYLVYVAVGAAIVVLLIIGAMFFIFYVIRARKLEQDRLNSEWQISFGRLRKPPTRREKDRQSKRSLQSGPSTITSDSKFTFDQEFSSYTVFMMEKELVLSTKHPPSSLTSGDYEHFVKLRKLDHDNLNKFIGLSIDGADYLTVWRYCSRSSLQDIIAKGSLSVDPFFIFCVIRDVAEGMAFLHHSFVSCHGSLRSGCCLVTDGWQVKITDHGLRSLNIERNISKKRLLWVAPEHLLATPPSASTQGDIYSFAIIASEIITRKPAWNLNERKESVDELLYLVRKGGHSPPRPDLNTDGIDINSALLHLVRDCWSERADERPTADVVCNLLRAMMPDKKANLFDHVFNMMEEYTTTLELEVEERTKELSAEKKKADVLLSRMLPKQVAERLKMGQTVEPEGFDSVSVFFSDVVKFTQLAAKCSPFQVVSLLNELYSNFDAIIEEHDAYKVESIGDGYLCVSGLPTRNGFNHIRHIVDMSIAFIEYVKGFRITHLPMERVELRIGINSGPCVAGVVGLSMPRYCLFGDTVNTASRMESNGRAGHIHMSGEAHHLLTNKFPGEYETQSRGEVIIKGKGVMETFWVHRRIDGARPVPHSTVLATPPPRGGAPTPPEATLHRRHPPGHVRATSPQSDVTSLARSASPEAATDAMYREFRRKGTEVVLEKL